MPETTPRISREMLASLAAEVGIDVVGATPVQAYDSTETAIAERRDRGFFGHLRFTMARPERSCHPERVFPQARTIVSAARCYWEDGPEPAQGQGRLPRYAWADHYSELRTSLTALGERLGGAFRVLVDDNDHVDREAAVRAGVGFYGKNTVVITEHFGSWVVLGTLLTEAVIESSPTVRQGCGSCRLCIDACPTEAIVEPGVLDATACLSTWTQSAGEIPEPAMSALEDRVYGCDICQDVCPWNRGVEKRRAGHTMGGVGVVDLAEWLSPAPSQAFEDLLARLYVPKNDPRWLRRNALVAAGNSGGTDVAAVAEYLHDPDPVLRAAAARAATRAGDLTEQQLEGPA